MHPILTKSEQRTYNILLKKSGTLTTRDDIAQSVWRKRWLEKYSDWQIDRLIYLLRKKLPQDHKIVTLRNSGYILEKKGIIIPDIKPQQAEGTTPTNSYLEYMNNSQKLRKDLKDLFLSLNRKFAAKNVLVINSYSVENVSVAIKYFGEKAKIFFTNFDRRALKMHEDYSDKKSYTNAFIIYDDIRESHFKNSMFDVVINDFRLNFNSNHRQNYKALKNIYRILKPTGTFLISVVVDARYESSRFGKNQEKAPINKDKPWTFSADEGLERKCFTVPYYKKLFSDTGFKLIKEYDIKAGKSWFKKLKKVEDIHSPSYRRYILKKQ